MVTTGKCFAVRAGICIAAMIAAFVAMSVGPRYACADWPTWQHDNRRTGATEEQLAAEALQLTWAWHSAAPPQTAWAGPAKWDAYAFHRNLPSMRNYDPVFHVIAVGDRVWFGSSSDDSLHCLDAGSGDEVWTYTTSGPVRLAPTWSDDHVYFGSDDGYARCVRDHDGQLVWEVTPADTSQPYSDTLILNNGKFIPFQPCRTGVLVDDGTAWFACALLPWKDAWLCAVDAKTGSFEGDGHFRKTLPGRTMEGSPALSSDHLILPQGRVAPRVFDRRTGRDLGEMVKSGGGSVVVVSLDENILHGPATDTRKGGFRQSSGKSREVVAGLGRGNALVVDGTTSWMLTDTEIIASHLVERKILWKADCGAPYTMIKCGDTLFVGGEDHVAAHSAKDGQLLWSGAVDGRVYGLAAAKGRLFASTDVGGVYCFSAAVADNGGPKSPSVATGADAKQGAEVKNTPAKSRFTNIEALADENLLGHWAFQDSSLAATPQGPSMRALQGPDLSLAARPTFSSVGNYRAIELDGAKQTVMVSPEFRQAPIPIKEFTAEAWVRVDQIQDWGGIIGVIQDNGSFERGWLLGFRKKRFCVAVCGTDGPQRLTYLTADKDFVTETWHHVAGVYDGKTMQLFVDGQLAAQSSEQSGEILYPDRAWFEIGAYHDQDELYRLRGGLHEVRLDKTALSGQVISDHFQSSKDRFPKKTSNGNLASGPWLQFTSSTEAIVRWTTTSAQATRLEFGLGDVGHVVAEPEAKTEHEAKLSGLRRHRMYQYRIGVRSEESMSFTQTFECDTFFNYSPVSASRIPQSEVPPAENVAETTAGNVAQQILSHNPATRGLCLVLGTTDADFLVQLCRESELKFVVADTDSLRVSELRQSLRRQHVYGNQVTVHLVSDLSQLPFVGNCANLVIAAFATTDSEFHGQLKVTAPLLTEIQRMTRPDGGVALLLNAGNNSPSKQLPSNFAMVASDQAEDCVIHRMLKSALPGASDWSHLYGLPDNSAFAGENLGGARNSDDLEVQWVGRPGPRYQADRSGRKPSPLSSGGRLFLQGLQRIIAVDIFNGTLLWSIEIPDLERFNMPRDCSNWCANREFLFVAVKNECWKIDTRDGRVAAKFPASGTGKSNDWGYIATVDNKIFGSELPAGTSWTSYWGGGDAGWYDARSGPVTFPICSERVFCNEASTGTFAWEYRGGLVLNPTITVSGETMYFVESRSKAVIDSGERRVGDERLWQDLHLVALDTSNGYPKWEKKLEPMGQQVVFYLAHAKDQLTVVSSADSSYRISSFADADGEQRWTQSTSWPGGKGDHGKAMSRPAIVGDRLFVRPSVLSLKDGSLLPETMPGGGCGTYACTTGAIFFRDGTVTMWDPEQAVRSTWPRLRPDCWLSTVPAGGMLLSPEGGGGCSCGTWMETSIGFMPKIFDRGE
jgi:outer membrane protein assembly factor BamB